jgi:BMFP domain-containing protein YqiC
MLNKEFIHHLSEKITEQIPKNVQSAGEDLEKNIKALVQNAFAKFNLVTREEFDAQSALLQKTVQRVEHLENELHRLEQQIRENKL